MANEDYEVGYGKPPKKTQFKQGRSGNPRGRPKGSVNLATRFMKIANTLVPRTKNGRSRNVPLLDLSYEQLATQAASGNLHAIQQFIRWAHLFEASGTDQFDDSEFDDLARKFMKDVEQRQQQEKPKEIEVKQKNDGEEPINVIKFD